MNFEATELEGVYVFTPSLFEDNRGYFFESFNQGTIQKHLGINIDFVQDNHSYSKNKHTIRGLHFQTSPKEQLKLVRVVQGSILDVAVDLRKHSKTFLQWVAVVLSSQNKRQLLIPKGFAHGFCTLEPHTEVLYKVDAFYSKEHDAGILWSDPQLKINWPSKEPVLSTKDQSLPLLNEVLRRL